MRFYEIGSNQYHLIYELSKMIDERTRITTDCMKYYYNSPEFVDNELEILDKITKDRGVSKLILEDNIYPMGDLDGDIYLFDCSIGIPLIINDKGTFLNRNLMSSTEHDVLDTCYLRKLLNGYKPPKCIVSTYMTNTTMDYVGNDVRDIFNTDIPEYTVYNSSQLNECLNDINNCISKRPMYLKTWYRGQREEFTIKRHKETIDLLGYHSSYQKVPSLVPSLGRKEFRKGLLRDYIRWMEVFNIWLISQYKEFKYKIPHKYNEILDLVNDLTKVREFCSKMYFDQDIPEDVEELLRGRETAYDAGSLCMQQYGFLTSMLDITADLNTALFFTHSQLNNKTNKYELTELSDNRILYVFAQYKNSCTYNMHEKIFDFYLPWEYEIPLRIRNQKCGLLKGADWLHSNTYSHRIIAKINLKGNDIKSTLSVEDLFPSEEKDEFFKILKKATPKLEDLYG